jgi:hypothetical protein
MSSNSVDISKIQTDMAALQQQQAMPSPQQGPRGASPQGGNPRQASTSVANMLQGIRGMEPNQ